MHLVVNANILVAELLRKRGRKLVAHPKLELYMVEKAWDQARHEMSKRIAAMVQKGLLTQDSGENLLADSVSLAEARVVLMPHVAYAPLENTARMRIPRDPDDWPTIALSLVLEAGIWTLDNDFLGCGLPTWTTDTLLAHLYH